jgi:hypothetical protein
MRARDVAEIGQVWNELWGVSYPSPYMQLYNASVHAIKAVSPKLSVPPPEHKYGYRNPGLAEIYLRF